MIAIQLLGNFCIQHEDRQTLDITAQRMQTLLAYLILHRGVLQSRHQIASLLWPDTSEGQSRTNLRNLLHRLKHSFPVIENYLDEDHGMLVWRADAPARLDVDEFRLAVADAKRQAASLDKSAEQEALEQAARGYAGDLLPGCYDDWILPFREELHQVYLDVLDRLVVLLEAQGDYRRAIEHAQTSLRHDPLNEAIYRHLIRLHGRMGDRTGGLRVYHTCVAVLDQELSIEPSAATREAYQELLVEAHTAETPLAQKLEPRQAKGSLPHPLTSFIGREREIGEVADLLASSRLLTLTGPPGAGKTRFGLEVAARLSAGNEFSDGVYWIDLTAAADQPAMTRSVASILGAREKPSEPLLETLIQVIGDRSLLLVLDNAEHVMDAVNALSSSFLSACPCLRMLITSREVLGIPGEISWIVPPLTFPPYAEGKGTSSAAPEPDALLQYEAVRLFVDRAAASLPTFRLTARNATVVARICTRLEGIPLAIELAAARVKMMTVDQIAERMEESLQLLRSSRGAGLTRHHTLEAAVEWSYKLLSEKEKVLLNRLAVFAGGFTIEAAEQVVVCCAEGGSDRGIHVVEVVDLLSRLIDKSLVKVVAGEQVTAVRYHLLEMIRQYAASRLRETGENETAETAHARYCVMLAEEADPKIRGPQQAAWLNRLDADHDNLRKALRWAAAQHNEEIGLRLVNSLWQFWDVRGHFKEGRQWFKIMLGMGSSRTAQRAKAFKGAGALAWSQSDYTEARNLMAGSLEIFRVLGEKRDLAVGLFNLALVIYPQGDHAAAVPLLEESLVIFKELNHKQGIANALNSLGVIASELGEYHRARSLYEESLAMRKELGDQRGLAIAYGNLGVVALRLGDLREAQKYMDESLRLYQEIGDRRGTATTQSELGLLAREQGNRPLAYEQYHKAIDIWRELDSKEGLATALEGIAGTACGTGRETQVVALLAAADSLRVAGGSPLLPSDVSSHERMLNDLRAWLGESDFAQAWSQGRFWSVEEAIAAARAFE